MLHPTTQISAGSMVTWRHTSVLRVHISQGFARIQLRRVVMWMTLILRMDKTKWTSFFPCFNNWQSEHNQCIRLVVVAITHNLYRLTNVYFEFKYRFPPRQSCFVRFHLSTRGFHSDGPIENVRMVLQEWVVCSVWVELRHLIWFCDNEIVWNNMAPNIGSIPF